MIGYFNIIAPLIFIKAIGWMKKFVQVFIFLLAGVCLATGGIIKNFKKAF